MSILITGSAGFIGFHLANTLLAQGVNVVGVDTINDYYDPQLKRDRLNLLKAQDNFVFHQVGIDNAPAMTEVGESHPDIEVIVHLAGQAGVRYSIEAPEAYIQANVVGQGVMLELCKKLPNLKHYIFASSSSIYGASEDLPYSVHDRADKPLSVYAATKRSTELLAYSYSHLFNIPITGLRFFTVYGPWGRPDMAASIFAKALINETPMRVFNHGKMRRNFSYVGDVVDGIIACCAKAPQRIDKQPPYRVYNIGNNKAIPLMDFIHVLEDLLGKQGRYEMLPMQAGDVRETMADISESTRDLGFEPKTDVEVGLKKFTDWFVDYYNAKK